MSAIPHTDQVAFERPCLLAVLDHEETARRVTAKELYTKCLKATNGVAIVFSRENPEFWNTSDCVPGRLVFAEYNDSVILGVIETLKAVHAQCPVTVVIDGCILKHSKAASVEKMAIVAANHKSQGVSTIVLAPSLKSLGGFSEHIDHVVTGYVHDKANLSTYIQRAVPRDDLGAFTNIAAYCRDAVTNLKGSGQKIWVDRSDLNLPRMYTIAPADLPLSDGTPAVELESRADTIRRARAAPRGVRSARYKRARRSGSVRSSKYVSSLGKASEQS